MPRAIPYPLREQIVQRRQQGESYPTIAAALAIKERTVRAVWQRYRAQGPAGLEIGYGRCGRRGPRFEGALVEAALAWKREHPRWGAGLIRVQLAGGFPGMRLPQARSLQRWFRSAGLQVGRGRRPRAETQRGQAPHEGWALDAKEQIGHQDGSQSCLLSVVDEASGAALAGAVFPPVPLGARVGSDDPSDHAPDLHALGLAAPDPGG